MEKKNNKTINQKTVTQQSYVLGLGLQTNQKKKTQQQKTSMSIINKYFVVAPTFNRASNGFVKR